MSRSPVAGHYDQPIDRESAAEILQRRAEQQAAPANQVANEVDRTRYEPARRVGSGAGSQPRSSTRQSPIEAMITSAARSIGTQIGRQLLRGVLGSLTRR
jgi:DNA double-strand break repair helicase HerA and related ATPase